jgi:chromate transporter
MLVRKTWWAAAFIERVTIASLGLMAGAAIDIGRSALVDVFSTILALASLLLIFKYKVKTHWIILGGGLLGIAYKLIVG